MIKQTITSIAEEIQKQKDYLTELDRLIGDADHGNNMSLGFSEFMKTIDGLPDTPQAVIKALGMTLMSKVGGASGPLYGMSMMKGSAAFSAEKDSYTLEEFKDFIIKFYESVITLGKSKEKDKTMLDVWIPLSKELESVKSLDKKDIMTKIDSYRDQTKDLKALKGRASYLGERSVGHIDPGAASSAIILKLLVEGIEE